MVESTLKRGRRGRAERVRPRRYDPRRCSGPSDSCFRVLPIVGLRRDRSVRDPVETEDRSPQRSRAPFPPRLGIAVASEQRLSGLVRPAGRVPRMPDDRLPPHDDAGVSFFSAPCARRTSAPATQQNRDATEPPPGTRSRRPFHTRPRRSLSQAGHRHARRSGLRLSPPARDSQPGRHTSSGLGKDDGPRV